MKTDYLPYKAQFIPHEDKEADFDKVSRDLEAFILARETGQQKEFLRSHFGEGYPIDLDTNNIIYDLLTGVTRSARFIYECENCGRVFIQKHNKYGKNVYGVYLPEEDTRNILQSQRKRRS